MVGSILGGAFRLLRQHPVSVLVWSILYLVGVFAIGLLRILVAPADPGSIAGAIGAGVLSQGLAIALVAVLITAATRATLHPYKRGACYLRLGANEARVFALLAMLTIASMVLAFLLTLTNGFLLSLSSLVLPVAAAHWIAAGLVLAELAAVVFVQVRLSIALPLTYLYEAITVDEAWAQSRGHFWSIFGAFAALALLLALAGLALLAVFFLPVLTTLVQAGINGRALAETLLMIVVAAKNLPAASQLILVSAMLALTALSFVLATATLASAARTMLGLKDGQIEDLRRRRG